MLVLLHSALECNRAIKLTSSSKQSCHRSPAQRGPITHLVVMPPRTVQVVGAVNLKYLSLSCLHEQMVVERASEFVHKSRRKQSHTPFGPLAPRTHEVRGACRYHSRRERTARPKSHANGADRRGRDTTNTLSQSSFQKTALVGLAARSPADLGSRAAAKKDEMTAAYSPRDRLNSAAALREHTIECAEPEKRSVGAAVPAEGEADG